MTDIASSAHVDKTAQIGDNVYIGPGCIVSAGVVIGDGCILKANVMILPGVELGCNNRMYANCVLGEEPQMLGTFDPPTHLRIGSNNVFRENVTINRGSPIGSGQTVVGDHNYFMIGSHLGHDVEVEDNVVLGNCSLVAGHCKLERNAWISALSGLHQFVTIGRNSFVAARSGITRDVPPFMKVSGITRIRVRGLNTIGLQRAGFEPDSIAALQRTYRVLYRREGESIHPLVEEMLGGEDLDDHVRYLLVFLQRSFQHRMGRYLELSRHP